MCIAMVQEFEPSIFIIDDEPTVRKALVRLLSSAQFRVEDFESVSEFLQAKKLDHPGCLLLDIYMPKTSGLEFFEQLVHSSCLLPVIFLTAMTEIKEAVQAMKSGAFDFLNKPIDEEILIASVASALKKNHQDRIASCKCAEILNRFKSLTRREKSVFKLVNDGLTNKVIASKLEIAEKTVKIHRARVMVKMQAPSLAELIRNASVIGLPNYEHASAKS